MERLGAGDVLSLIRARVDELERENGDLRRVNSKLLGDVARLRRLLHRRKNLLQQARRSRDMWRERAMRRRQELETSRWYLVESHPKSKRYLREAA